MACLKYMPVQRWHKGDGSKVTKDGFDLRPSPYEAHTWHSLGH